MIELFLDTSMWIIVGLLTVSLIFLSNILSVTAIMKWVPWFRNREKSLVIFTGVSSF